MFVTMFNRLVLWAPAHPRALSSLAKFQPDLEYLVDPKKRDEIKANTARRRGRGDVDAVAEMSKQLQVSQTTERNQAVPVG